MITAANIPTTIIRKSMVNRRIGVFPSNPGVHVTSTVFDDVADNATDVITGGYGSSIHAQFAWMKFNLNQNKQFQKH